MKKKLIFAFPGVYPETWGHCFFESFVACKSTNECLCVFNVKRWMRKYKTTTNFLSYCIRKCTLRAETLQCKLLHNCLEGNVNETETFSFWNLLDAIEGLPARRIIEPTRIDNKWFCKWNSKHTLNIRTKRELVAMVAPIFTGLKVSLFLWFNFLVSCGSSKCQHRNVVCMSSVIFGVFYLCGTNFFGSCVNDGRILKLPLCDKTNNIIYVTESVKIHLVVWNQNLSINLCKGPSL